MSDIPSKPSEQNSIHDAYRTPSIPDHVPLANPARFWIAFAMVCIGYTTVLACLFIAPEWRYELLLLCGIALILGARWIDVRIRISNVSAKLNWILLAVVVSFGCLMIAHQTFYKNSPILERITRGNVFYGLIVSALAGCHLVGIMRGLSQTSIASLPIELSPRFTDRTRIVLQLATIAAERLRQDLGSEHVLLGLVQEGKGVATNVLRNMNVDTSRIDAEVKRLGGTRSASPQSKLELGFILQHAMEESTALGHHYIGTEHLLLGLLAYREGLAASILTELGITSEAGRQEIRNLLGVDLSTPEVADA